MTEWLNERYISRDEHQKIVAYYKKLVSQLYSTIRDLRKPEEAAPVQQPARPAAETPATVVIDDGRPVIRQTDNVIVVNFRRERMTSSPGLGS
ncbi:hypothetical protein J5J10_07590 [Ciceribacter sp. L1K23]|uniref:hypothetical protein n=1 Tax=Ciceribacter sp. L1K23 TaxID=2820276 RepID=UPI001B835A9D|nr:hypothetical protein [Ciceribacter sp. L1K23]MBR0555541.1 hypothetical protein [Ciceribacter sp. L1K23]